MALQVVDRAIQAFGAEGVSQDPDLAYAWAGLRTLRIADVSLRYFVSFHEDRGDLPCTGARRGPYPTNRPARAKACPKSRQTDCRDQKEGG